MTQPVSQEQVALYRSLDEQFRAAAAQLADRVTDVAVTRRRARGLGADAEDLEDFHVGPEHVTVYFDNGDYDNSGCYNETFPVEFLFSDEPLQQFVLKYQEED